MKITPSLLYSYFQCPHKPWRDHFGPEVEKMEVNPFVQLLWEEGRQHEDIVAKEYFGDFVNLGDGQTEERIKQTELAMAQKIPLIYQPILDHGNLFGIPDFLELQQEGFYLPIDIKSGKGYENIAGEAGAIQLKKQFALQLSLYVEILTRKGMNIPKKGFIVDGNWEKIEYDLSSSFGVKNPRTYWEFYEETKASLSAILYQKHKNDPAMGGICKNCPWYRSCKSWCENANDPTLIYELGRSQRDLLKSDLGVSTVYDVAGLDIPYLLERKKSNKQFLKGIGEKTLTTMKKRAAIYLENEGPVIYSSYPFPEVTYELYFDIEDDPIRNFVYLHGIYVKENGRQYFKSFFAEQMDPNGEKAAWENFWSYIRSLPANSFAVYYYSHHEKSTYDKLQKKYPEVITPDDLNTFFNHPNVIDLFKIVEKTSDWPLGSYSIKELATYIGFSWRDETPSGALSIQWFNDYLNSGNPDILNRILEYNEDDCKAIMVVKERLSKG